MGLFSTYFLFILDSNERSYLILLAYFPDKEYELIFVSPKVHNAVEDTILNSFEVLADSFANENVTFKYISNNRFRDEIVKPTIEGTKDYSDTNELFLRAVKLSNLFGMALSEKNTTQRITNGKKIFQMKN